MSAILFSINHNGVATMTLNRPEALNSLNYDMLLQMKQKLEEWENDDHIQVVVLNGNGDKGFCAGGDIKTLYAAKESEEAANTAERFFSIEYETDKIIYHYKKPIVAILDGIVMGGGVGLAYGASHRVITERTKWAMPEMNIGFFPDVGAAYFLNKTPGKSGLYLALTASVIQSEDILYIRAADLFCSSNQLESLLHSIKNTNWQNISVEETLNNLLNEYQEKAPEGGYIEQYQAEIDSYFSHQTVEEIIDALALASSHSHFAATTKETMLSKSPVSLKVTLKQLIEGENKSLEKCFDMDLMIAKNFMRHDDFFEGVRSVLIDKDRQPTYKYKKLADVSDDLVESFFNVPSLSD